MNSKINYYFEEFSKRGLDEELIKEFSEDRSFCPYGGDMKCAVCSCGCFKINVIWLLEQLWGEDKIHELLRII